MIPGWADTAWLTGHDRLSGFYNIKRMGLGSKRTGSEKGACNKVVNFHCLSLLWS
ncbi:hypothetical protein HORIV_71070 [Vreelandella olivaria]|uniref:Uncharacterized protein n=1 Tax=Vreelandella olivaria TaxID=390919 RepID=A0ABM7GUX1_9GAMM|nr:hypothetical protein HORIV_71070 [Halomonas olivaria]